MCFCLDKGGKGSSEGEGKALRSTMAMDARMQGVWMGRAWVPYRPSLRL